MSQDINKVIKELVLNLEYLRQKQYKKGSMMFMCTST